jgi:hypothetical protein
MAVIRRGMMAAAGGLSRWRSAVIRLHQYQGVQFTSPVMGRYGQYTALIPPGAIPGESREITGTSPDLCGLMNELDDLFGSPGSEEADCRLEGLHRKKP